MVRQSEVWLTNGWEGESQEHSHRHLWVGKPLASAYVLEKVSWCVNLCWTGDGGNTVLNSTWTFQSISHQLILWKCSLGCFALSGHDISSALEGTSLPLIVLQCLSSGAVMEPLPSVGTVDLAHIRTNAAKSNQLCLAAFPPSLPSSLLSFLLQTWNGCAHPSVLGLLRCIEQTWDAFQWCIASQHKVLNVEYLLRKEKRKVFPILFFNYIICL